MMKVLITGGSGFIGTNLVEYYLTKGIDVLNVDIAPPRNTEHNPYWRNIDIRDLTHLRIALNEFSPTHIINLAAQTGTTDKGKTIEDFDTNYKGVENLITACNDLPNLQRIVFTSSMLVCRAGYLPKNDEDYCPPNLYGKSKVMGEKIVRQKAKELGYSWVIVRPIGIWGPWFGTPYKEFFLTISKGLYVHPGKKGAVQSLGFVGNTIHQLHKLATAPVEKAHGKIFYLGDTPSLNLRDWANSIQRIAGSRKIPTVPHAILKILAKGGDICRFLGWKNPLLTSSRLKNMLIGFIYDIDPLVAEEFPYTLEEGVQITVDWLREHGIDKPESGVKNSKKRGRGIINEI